MIENHIMLHGFNMGIHIDNSRVNDFNEKINFNHPDIILYTYQYINIG